MTAKWLAAEASPKPSLFITPIPAELQSKDNSHALWVRALRNANSVSCQPPILQSIEAGLGVSCVNNTPKKHVYYEEFEGESFNNSAIIIRSTLIAGKIIVGAV